MELDDKVCYCFHVTKRKLANYIRLHNLRRASQLSQCNSAGTGCGWCVAYLKRMFEQAESPDSAGATSEPTPQQYARQRAAYIKSGKGKPAAGAEPFPDDPDEEQT